MANPSKAKGTKCETDTVRYLRANGFPNAERRALSGSNDRGDILADAGLVFECKHWAIYSDVDVLDWQAQTAREMRNANASEGVLIIRRTGKADPGTWWAWRYFTGRGWYCTWLAAAAVDLRLEGWGTPL